MEQMDKSIHSDRLLSTPMTATMQRIKQQFNLLSLTHLESDENGDVDESLHALLKQTWNMFGVSSLFGFNYENERQLKLYGKRLREEIASILPQENVTYEVNFTIDESISRSTISNPPAFRIEVYAKNADTETAEKCIYTGILMSWGTSIAEIEHENCVKLPILLCRGTKNTMIAVHMTLGNMFDCLVIALPATDDDLRWLVPVILHPRDSEENFSHKGQVMFEYKIPGLPASDSIVVKFDTSVLAQLWNTIFDDDKDFNVENGILLKHVDRFHEVLQHQMLRGAGMQLGLTKLNKISMPSLTIMENKIKSVSSNVLSKVLLFFNEKAIEVLHTLNLDSTVGTSSVVS